MALKLLERSNLSREVIGSLPLFPELQHKPGNSIDQWVAR